MSRAISSGSGGGVLRIMEHPGTDCLLNWGKLRGSVTWLRVCAVINLRVQNEFKVMLIHVQAALRDTNAFFFSFPSYSFTSFSFSPFSFCNFSLCCSTPFFWLTFVVSFLCFSLFSFLIIHHLFLLYIPNILATAQFYVNLWNQFISMAVPLDLLTDKMFALSSTLVNLHARTIHL